MQCDQARAVIEHRVHQRCACGSALSSQARFAQAADSNSNFVLRGTQRVYERSLPFRVHHIALDLDIDHAGSSLSGSASLSFTRVDSAADTLTLDATAFDIASVELRIVKRQPKPRRKGGKAKTKAKAKKPGFKATDFVYDSAQLQIAVPADAQEAIVRIGYRVQPRRGMYFLRPDESVPQRPNQVWTQCQDEDARCLFPCHDKPHIKQTMDIKLRVPNGWFALSNGDLASSKAAQRRGEFHYRMRQALPSYLFTIVAGEFSSIEDALGELPVNYYVPVGREDDGRRTFGNTPAMIALFGKLTGVDYPWTKYAQIVVSDFIFGGMENTGATTMYEHILLDERAAIDIDSDDLIAHELGHQWFGDLVTCRDWSHAWLNEGFATYLEQVWRQHHHGQDEYERSLAVDLGAYLGEARGRYQRPVVCQDYAAPIDIFDRHLYEKGALFLHSLRCKLGDDAFWAGVQRYLKQHAHGLVETRDLLRAMEASSGQSLEEHFEHGLLRATYPRAEVTVRYDKGLLLIDVKQSLGSGQKPMVFDLEIDISEGGGEGAKGRANAKRQTRRLVRRIDSRQQLWSIPQATRPQHVVVDPRLRVIGSLNIKAPANMLRDQLAHASSGRGRSQAATLLGRRDDPLTIKALQAALEAGRQFWGTRAAAALALGNIRSDAALEVLLKATRIRHPKVRRRVVQALGRFRNERAATALARLARKDESILVAASACRALGATRSEQAFDVLKEMLDRPSWADSVRAGAIDGLAKLRDERGVELLRDGTRYGHSNRSRRSAIAALPTLASTRETRELLQDLLDDSDPYLRVRVVEALRELDDSKARGALRRQLERDLDGRVRRRIRELLRDLGSKGKAETKRLREQLQELRREHQSLKARLSKLEAADDK